MNLCQMQNKRMEKLDRILEKACFDKSPWAQRSFPVCKTLRATAESGQAACLKLPDKWDSVWDTSGLWI